GGEHACVLDGRDSQQLADGDCPGAESRRRAGGARGGAQLIAERDLHLGGVGGTEFFGQEAEQQTEEPRVSAGAHDRLRRVAGTSLARASAASGASRSASATAAACPRGVRR